MKVLIVDDSKVIRNIIKDEITEMDFETFEAKDGFEALLILEKHFNDLDLVLLDLNMPRLDGTSLIRIMRGSSHLKKIPFILITAEPNRMVIIDAIKAGANNYLMKPFDKNELFKKIEDTLSIKLIH